MIDNEKKKETNDSQTQQVQHDSATSNQQSLNNQPTINTDEKSDKDEEGWVAVGSGLGINE